MITSLLRMALVFLCAILPVRAVLATDVTEILIGYAGPLSGASAAVGKSMLNAVHLAVDEGNKRGMHIGGKPVVFKVISQDDRTDPRTAELVARYLVKIGVTAVIGHWNSAASLAAAPIYESAGTIQISPATMSRRYTAEGRRTSFRTIGNNDGAGKFTADYAVKTLGVTRVALINDGTPFGQGIAEQFGKTVKEHGAAVLGSYAVSDKTSDFNRILAELKVLKPDAVFFGGLDVQAAALARGVVRMQLGARFIAASGTVGLPFLKAAGADGNHTVVLEPGLPLERMPGWKSFEKNYMQKFDSSIDLYAPFAYDAAQVLIAAIRQADSTDQRKIVSVLRDIRFNGMTGPVSFNAEGDLKQPVFTIYEVQDQSWVVRKTITGNR